jgi:hypothetical protein
VEGGGGGGAEVVVAGGVSTVVPSAVVLGAVVSAVDEDDAVSVAESVALSVPATTIWGLGIAETATAREMKRMTLFKATIL